MESVAAGAARAAPAAIRKLTKFTEIEGHHAMRAATPVVWKLTKFTENRGA